MADTKNLPTTPKEKDEFADYRSPDEASFDKFILALDRAYHRPFVMMWRSFLHGLMSAIGAALGALVIVAATGLIINQLGGIELLKPSIERLQEMILDTPALRGLTEQQEQMNQQIQEAQEALNQQDTSQ